MGRVRPKGGGRVSAGCPNLCRMPLSPPPARPDLLRRLALGRRGRTVGLATLVVVDAAFTISAFDLERRVALGLGSDPAAPLTGLGGTISVLGMALAVTVVWRDRWPVALTLVGCAASFLAHLGPTLALIGLMTVIRLRPWARTYQLAPPVVLVTAVATWRDIDVEPRSMSFWAIFLGQEGAPHSWWVPVLLTVAAVGGFVGLGLWLRTRADLHTAEDVAASERQMVTTLTDQVSRQTERERLAREIHDGLGHNLSILSVHAGALEAMAEAAGDELVDRPEGADAVEWRTAAQLKESAQVVRETAAKSVSELHSLLNILRNPGDADVAAPTKTLRDVRALIDDSVTAGMPLVATVYVEDGEAMDPPVAQAAYRIVQELLTNARKHAATVPVRLTMTGGPAEGELVIGTANHLPPPRWPPSHDGEVRPGTGLVGIRERVEHYGGDMQWGADAEAVFRVSVRLPWTLVDGADRRGA